MSEPIRVGVIGAGGRLGSHSCALIEESRDLSLVARLGSSDDLERGLREGEAHVGLDLTVAGLGGDHGLVMLEAGVRPVIGTSGISIEENRRLDEAARARGLGGLVVPNFSLGMWLLQRACEEAARFFPHAEIVESHSITKRDAPSGTSTDTAERISRARGEEEPGDTPIHSVRLPGVLSNQEVIFGGEGELLRLRHETYHLSSFSAGILAALRYAATAEGVGRGIGLAFEARGVR